jgi:hypothetical protein
LISDHKTGVPFDYYSGVYHSLDPEDISRRCGFPFDPAVSAFMFRILGEERRALYPGFALLDSAGETVDNPYENILFIRYLCEGKYFPARGKRFAYNEIPWSSVYFRRFKSRCIRRCVRAFGRDIPAFKNIFEQNPRIQAELLPLGDTGYRFEFINGFFISIILWGADNELPPSAQMLFDDNVVSAFTAEDIAVAGEILVERLKQLRVTMVAQSGNTIKSRGKK